MTAEKIPTWIKQVLMPEFIEIKNELKTINTRIDTLNEKMTTKIDVTNERIANLRTELKMEIGSLRTEMSVRLDSIEKRIPVMEKITAMEIKIADLERKLAMAEA